MKKERHKKRKHRRGGVNDVAMLIKDRDTDEQKQLQEWPRSIASNHAQVRVRAAAEPKAVYTVRLRGACDLI